MISQLWKDFLNILDSLQQNDEARAYGIIESETKTLGKVTMQYAIHGKTIHNEKEEQLDNFLRSMRSQPINNESGKN